MRRLGVFVALLLVGSGCGGSPSVNDYVEALNAMNDEFSPRGEANYLGYMDKPDPTIDDLRTLLDSNLTLRLDVDEALGEVEAPEQIAEAHEQWTAWHARLLEADRAQAERAASAGSVEEFLNSAEFNEWGSTLRDGSMLCDEFEGRLNSTDAQDLFAGTAWMPSDLTDVVHAAIGCESFPDDIDDIATLFNP